jgi:hypothetical protein
VTLVPHELPDYVDLGGRQVYQPPYTARHAEIFGFVLKADRAAIDGLLLEAFTEPSKGAVDYRCSHDNVLITFAQIERLSSRDEPDSRLGYLPESEVSVWCLAADVIAGGRLVWYLPYVFTDSGQTVVTGREVYGYPKQIGTFPGNYPTALQTHGVTTVEALSINPFGPDDKAVPRPMITVNRKPLAPGGDETVPAGASALEEVMIAFPHEELEVTTDIPFGRTPKPSAVITPVGGEPPSGAGGTLPWGRRLLDVVRGGLRLGDSFELVVDMVNDPKLVFLKQFRDVLCPTKACYQAVVEAPLGVHLLSANYRPLDPGLFEILVESWDSHPIASDLGVPAQAALTPRRAFHARLDFDIELGEEVWRATT